FAMSLPAVMKHLDVLSDAHLIVREKSGRVVACRISAQPMEQAMAWLGRYQRFWSDNLDSLVAFVEQDRWQTHPTPPEPASTLGRASRSRAASTRVRKKSMPRGPTRKG